MFTTFSLFKGLPNEQIIKVVRRDTFIFVKRVFFFLFLFILPAAFYFLLNIMFPMIWNGTLGRTMLSLAGMSYYLFVWLMFFFAFLDYYMNLSVITNERIIDITQKGFFDRVISEQSFDRVQDVTSEVKGFWATIMRYGDVYIQTAGEIERFVFEEVPQPEAIRDLIIKLIQDKKVNKMPEK